MTSSPLADFLTPEGFVAPGPTAVLREASLLGEAGRFAIDAVGRRTRLRKTPYAARAAARLADPVVLVPGFMAGDASLTMMARVLRERGWRTYRSSIQANVGCTLNGVAQLEGRLEQISQRRGSRVQIVGHSLGGMLARGVAVRRPDLVSGIVTLGSPMLAPGAHHASLSRGVDLLVRLSQAGWPGLMAVDCVAGDCARQSFDESREPLAEHIGFTAIYSKRDGIVDWRACVDPDATAVEATCSHVGMAFDPRVITEVVAALRRNERHSASAPPVG